MSSSLKSAHRVGSSKSAALLDQDVQKADDILVSEKYIDQDFALSEQFQQFSSELLRLALAALGVVGLLITEVLLDASSTAGLLSRFEIQRPIVGVGILCLLVAIAYAMVHRYSATDALAHEVCYLRLCESVSNSTP